MKVTPTAIADVLLLEPRVFGDARGCFFESYNERAFRAAVGSEPVFVQDNHSCSARHVLRGLHYQLAPHTQGKLVRVVKGAVFDVAVDVRRGSPSFGRWAAVALSAANRQQLWIPPGFAHGFLALEEGTEVLYKTTDYYHPEAERSIRWDDPQLAIPWPLGGEPPLLSPKDEQAPLLSAADLP